MPSFGMTIIELYSIVSLHRLIYQRLQNTVNSLKKRRLVCRQENVLFEDIPSFQRLFTEYKSDQFWPRYGQKRDFVLPRVELFIGTRESRSTSKDTLLSNAFGLTSPRVPASPGEASQRVQKSGLFPALG